MELMEIIDENLNVENKEKWVVENDSKADWAIEKIKELNAEFNRYKMAVDSKKAVLEKKIDELNRDLEMEEEKLNNDKSFFESKLAEYFEKVPKRETKTQLIYKLPGGNIRKYKAKSVLDYDKTKLLDYAKEQGLSDLIKTTESFKYAEFKKNLVIEGDTIVNKETGEVIDCEGLKVKNEPERFVVEVK